MKIGHHIKGNGPEKILFLHDWLGDSDNYKQLSSFLDGKNFTVAFMDLRGHGRSRNVSGEYNVQESMNDAFGLLKDLGWSQFHVVAHSLSTLIVQKMFMEFEGKEKILSATLLAPVLPTGLPIDEKGFFSIKKIFKDYYEQKLGPAAYQQILQSFQEITSDKDLNMAHWLKFEIQEDQDVVHPKALRGHLTMFMENLMRGKKISYYPPLYVVLGEHDEGVFSPQFVRESFTNYYDRFELDVLPDSGHFFMMTKPGELSQKIQKFIKKHARFLSIQKMVSNQ